MDNNEVKNLIDAFKGYRDLLTPIQSNLNDFIETYDEVRGDIAKLNTAFSGDVKGNLDKIYKTLSAQAEKSADLASEIDKFLRASGKYLADTEKLIATLGKISDSLGAVNSIEAKAEEQLGKLDSVLEEKRKNYNVKELQKTVESYNENVRKMNDFINRDVALTVTESNKTLNDIKCGNNALLESISKETKAVSDLAEKYAENNALIRKLVEKKDVDEAYIYDMLDAWAESRKVKTRKR